MKEVLVRFEKMITKMISTLFLWIVYFFIFMIASLPVVGVIYLIGWFELLSIENQIILYSGIVGIILPWVFAEKNRKSFYLHLTFWLVFGLLIFNNYLEAYYIYVVVLSLAIGYALYRLGVVDLLSYISQVIDNFFSNKFKDFSFQWLILFYRCKLKNYNVYLKDGKNINESIVIEIKKNDSSCIFLIKKIDIKQSYSEFLQTNSKIHNEDGVQLKLIEEIAKEEISINPKIEILITGYEDEKSVFELVNTLSKNRVIRVGFLNFSFYCSLLNSIMDKKNES
jgi:hypothetical protein